MKLGYLLYDNIQTDNLDKYHSFITETVKTREKGGESARKTDGTTTIPSTLMD